MAEFTPINTQEEFDNMVKDRLARTTKTVTEEVTKNFEGYVSPEELGKKTADYTKQIDALNVKVKDYDTSIADLTAKNKAYEQNSVKMKIAHEVGIPYELAGKLSGSTEDEIKEDAQTLSKFISKPNTPPLANGEPAPNKNGTQTNGAVLSLLQKMKEGN